MSYCAFEAVPHPVNVVILVVGRLPWMAHADLKVTRGAAIVAVAALNLNQVVAWFLVAVSHDRVTVLV